MAEVRTAGSAAEAVEMLARLAAEAVAHDVPDDWDQVEPLDHLVHVMGHLSAASRYLPHLTIGTLSAVDHQLFQAHCARTAIYLAYLAFQPTD